MLSPGDGVHWRYIICQDDSIHATAFLPVSQLRPLWQFVVSHTLKRAPSNKGLPTNVSSLSACGLWLHNFDGHINDLLYDMSNYGVHEWNGDNEWFVNWFHVQPTTEVLLSSIGSLNYWLSRTPQSIIEDCQYDPKANTVYNRLNQVFDPLLKTYQNDHHILPSVERDRIRYREYLKSQHPESPGLNLNDLSFPLSFPHPKVGRMC